MKKRCISVLLLLAGLASVHAADKYAPAGNSLADAMQWLAVRTACLSEYGMAFTEDFTEPDPRDNYRPADIREYLAGQSGGRTRVQTIYGICFDYARAAYDYISQNSNYYGNLGVREWYMAATWKTEPGVIKLFDPVQRGQHTTSFNGVYMKEISRHNVRHHGNSPMNHAWLWAYGNDGTVYWIDPTWTDGYGYVVWGVVRNGREDRVGPAAGLCATRPPGSAAFASFTSGDANRSQGNYGQAIDDYNQTIQVEPNYAAAYNNRGLAYYHQRDYDRAIADFNQAITLDPAYADAWNNRGLAYYAKRDYGKALADYTQALTLDPGLALAYNGRACVYLAQQNHAQALADVNQAIRLWPREAAWYVTRGEIFLDMKDSKQRARARQEFEMALRLYPGYTRARELLGRAR
ncbi:MAG: tetratricopeptide repeat protein [Treponema sp.]|nr:tetratricopeptide repeat protein [Treponema sp.]